MGLGGLYASFSVMDVLIEYSLLLSTPFSLTIEAKYQHFGLDWFVRIFAFLSNFLNQNGGKNKQPLAEGSESNCL